MFVLLRSFVFTHLEDRPNFVKKLALYASSLLAFVFRLDAARADETYPVTVKPHRPAADQGRGGPGCPAALARRPVPPLEWLAAISLRLLARGSSFLDLNVLSRQLGAVTFPYARSVCSAAARAPGAGGGGGRWVRRFPPRLETASRRPTTVTCFTSPFPPSALSVPRHARRLARWSPGRRSVVQALQCVPLCGPPAACPARKNGCRASRQWESHQSGRD